MTSRNTHRRPGAARTPRVLPVFTAGTALAGALLFGGISTAQAAPSGPVNIDASATEAATVLQQGSRSSAVTALQSDLRVLGFDLAVDGSFGPRTAESVRTYQTSRALTGSGVVDPGTNAALNVDTDAASPGAGQSKLRMGDRSEQVKSLQGAMNRSGHNLDVDGSFGPATLGAVTQFQASRGLAVDGVVGPLTWGALTATDTAADVESAPVGTSPGSTSGADIVEAARQQVGTPYSWGSANPAKGLDCSGLTSYAYSQVGITLPRTSSAQEAGGRSITQAQAQPGDLVHWPGHVAIYAGNGTVIDASGSKQRVVERAIWGTPSFVTYR